MIGFDTVNFGPMAIDIEVARIRGGSGGKRLLITAGMDGDEYAGMEAARRLISEFSRRTFVGDLIIIPVVNIPGFQAKISKNPMDGLYPKYIYPGKQKGKPTERLCWWLSRIAGTADFWLDMHGGATNEEIIPFIGTWESGDRDLDAVTRRVIQHIDAEYAIYKRPIPRTKYLAKTGCGYLLAESGDRGKVRGKDVLQHIRWARQVMSALGMTSTRRVPTIKRIFSDSTEYVVRHDGIWHASARAGAPVKKGETLGTMVSQYGQKPEKVTVKHDGIVLWQTLDAAVRRGEVVAGMADVLL